METDRYECEPRMSPAYSKQCLSCGLPYRIGEDGYCSTCLGDREPMKRDWKELQRKWAAATGRTVGRECARLLRKRHVSEWGIYQIARRAAHYGLEYLGRE
jgi:hypothetical protein